MRVVHLLRKYDPAEWGGTEAAVLRLCDGLRRRDVTPLMYCPKLDAASGADPAAIRRFKACLPIWGISREEKRQMIAVGGNLMSFDLLPALWREPKISLIHTHTLGRLGGIAATVARARRLPFVITIHGGLLDLPPALKKEFNEAWHGVEWGKLFGLLLQSRHLIAHADAVLTCNPKEAALMRASHPDKRVEVQPHGIDAALYQGEDHRAAAGEAFPQIRDRRLLLCVGRIDPVKNQEWLVLQAPEIFRKHPRAVLVFAGACTDEAYGRSIERRIRHLGLQDRILFTGGLPPGDPRLVGLFQKAEVTLLPSLSETFGLVLLEAWAAGATVISSRTSGALALVRDGENGWLFDPAKPHTFHDALNLTLFDPALRARLAAAGRELVNREYDQAEVVGRIKHLYEELIEARSCTT